LSNVTPPKEPDFRIVLGLLAWLALVAVAAGTGAVATVDAAQFYASLQRPGWAPPSWLFGPVWTLLYVAMAVSAWLVWKRGGWRGAGLALGLFCAQLPLNALWSWLFFAWRRGAAALADIVLLWIVVLVVTVMFYRVSKPAAGLLVPYLLWVTFAGALNYAIWQRNPALLG
jgi:benzodiazapine receptor